MRLWLLSILLIPSVISAAEPTAAERGKKALLETSFIPPAWRQPAFDSVWKRWDGVKEKPVDYAAALRDRYGLHVAPYKNDDLPMGLRKASFLFVQGVSIDCMLCHGSSIMGKSYVGLGNSSLEIQSLFEEMSGADGRPPRTPFVFGNVRGTSEAGGMAVYLLGFRNPDLSLIRPRKELGLHDDLCEDVPPWWHLKKKKTMYHTGGADARSVRSKMQFMMTPITTRQEFEKHEAAFRDIDAYLKTIEAPKYPFAIDQTLASTGAKLFATNCVSCHGTYGENSTYPNKIVPLDEIGTDPKRYEGITPTFADYYNQSWFAKEQDGWFSSGYQALPSRGYQAPPLDGIWATAPYFHNGSVPTVYHVLNSKKRPTMLTRSFKTDEADYDKVKLGWKYRELEDGPAVEIKPIERRKIYDTRLPGRGNGGHTFGDHLTEEERMAVIEYLKTL
ncbi:MAG: c-type cytochrome [Planctomycetes bacterium]|nr:c-type cytochrome [Planctomycetota bacterium]